MEYDAGLIAILVALGLLGLGAAAVLLVVVFQGAIMFVAWVRSGKWRTDLWR